MAYAFVQQNANDAAATATTITVTLTPTAGNLLVFCVTGDQLDTTSIALSDNLGAHNTFTQIATDLVTGAGSDQRCAWYFAENCKGGATTFTATYSASTRFRTIYVAEYSGIATSGSFLNGARQEQAGPGTATDAVSSGLANATSQPALVWGFSLDIFTNATPTAGTGFTSRTGVWSTNTCLGRPEDKRVTATGNVAATFTTTVGTDSHATGIGIFAEAASSAAAVDDDGAPPPPSPPAPPPSPVNRDGRVDDDVPMAAASVPDDDAPQISVPRALAWVLSRTGTDGDDLPGTTSLVTFEGDDKAPIWPGALVWRRPAPTVEDSLPLVSIFPLTVDATTGRFLRQSDGTPFLICGDSTWSLSVDLSAVDQIAFLDNCAALGINCVMSNAIEHCFSVVKPPKDIDGNLPFTQRLDAASYTGSPNGTSGANGTQGQFSSDNYGSPASQSPDPTFINGTYWNRVDALISACLARNIAIFIWPMYLGFHGGQEGWMVEMEKWDAVTGAGGFTGQPFADPSKSKMWNYGAWLGARWAAYPNIIWVAGGDYGTNTQTLTAAQEAAVKSCIDGVKSQLPSSLWTAHWDRPCKSDDKLISGTTWALNFCYTDDNTAEATRAAYSSAAKPTYLGENNYEDGSFGGTLPFRKYLYWGFLGGIAGGFYGQEQLWRFDDGTPGTLWSTLLTKQGRLDASRQFALWKSKPWHRLIPNGLGGIGTLITAGGGTASPQSTDYVAAACTPQGDLLLAYIPPAHVGSVTINMAKMTARVSASWFDPTNSAVTAIGSFANTGTLAFTPPANNNAGETDFLLMLETDGAILDEYEVQPVQLPLNAATWNHFRWKPWFPYDAEDLPIPGPPSTSSIDDREDIVGLLGPLRPTPWFPVTYAGSDDEFPPASTIDDDVALLVTVASSPWAAPRPLTYDDDAPAAVLEEDTAWLAIVPPWPVVARSLAYDDEVPAAAPVSDEDATRPIQPSGLPPSVLFWPSTDEGGQPPFLDDDASPPFHAAWVTLAPRPLTGQDESPLSLFATGSVALGDDAVSSAGSLGPAPSLSGGGDITLSGDTAVGSDGSREAPVSQHVFAGSVGAVGPQRRPITHRVIRIEDIDRGVRDWFDRVANVHVTTPQGDRRKVTVKFASGERWVAAADRQGIRDRDGRLILPVIQIRRVGVDPSTAMSALGTNVPRLQVARLVSEKTSDLANLDLSRPISQRRLRDSAVYDVYTVPFPSANIISYRVRVQCQYQTHLNEVIEKLLSRLEFSGVRSFVVSLGDDSRNRGLPGGLGSTELIPPARAPFEQRRPLDDYYVVGYLEGDLGDEGNMDEFTDQERILQLQFGFRVPVTLMLDPEGDRPAVQHERTAFGITMGDEVVHVIDDPSEADRIFGRKK